MHRALVLVVLMVTACATTPGTRSRMLHGEDGQIAVVETPQGNQRVDVTLTGMSHPSVYEIAATTFVVWIIPADGVPVRAGAIDYNPRTESGGASFFTPYDDFRVLVTAEPTQLPVEPRGRIIVDQEVAV